jgi:fructose-bisphosphate aldolase class II
VPLVKSRELLLKARAERYAVGGFNASNLETVQAIVEAAEAENAPVIVQISEGTIRYAGLRFSARIVRTAAALAAVPVVLHLDHGSSLGQNILCLREGFTSLMYDGTERPVEALREETGIRNPPFELICERIRSAGAFDENLRDTRRIVEIAHACGVPVEAELGRIPRVSDFANLDAGGVHSLPDEVRSGVRLLQADPGQVEEFVGRTGCDSIAVACGSIHGMREDSLFLDLGLLEAVAARVDVPLVLHGSSGVVKTRKDAAARGLKPGKGEGSLRDAISLGVAKINVSTELQVTFLGALRSAMDADPHAGDLRKLFLPAKQALKEKVRSLIRLFGSSGKAG